MVGGDHGCVGRVLGWPAPDAAVTGARSGDRREQLHVRRWGNGGPTVVFLHGLGASSRYWSKLREISHGYNAIAPDLLGFGRSPKPNIRYDVDTHLEHLVPLVPRGAILVAHSTGAVLAAALALHHRDRVHKLLLLGAPAFPDTATAQRDVAALGVLASMTMSGGWRGKIAELAMHTFVKPIAIALARWPNAIFREVVTDFWRHTRQSYASTLREVVVGHPIMPDLRELVTQTRLLYGDRDRIADLDGVRMLASQHHAMSLDVVAGGHHIAIRNTATVARTLDGMVSERS